jgi:hypothetical protein
MLEPWGGLHGVSTIYILFIIITAEGLNKDFLLLGSRNHKVKVKNGAIGL